LPSSDDAPLSSRVQTKPIAAIARIELSDLLSEVEVPNLNGFLPERCS